MFYIRESQDKCINVVYQLLHKKTYNSSFSSPGQLITGWKIWSPSFLYLTSFNQVNEQMKTDFLN